MSEPDPLLARAKRLPKQPGVYLFKNALDKVIYVGKANVIRARVLQYFQVDRRSKKTQHLMEEAVTVDFCITGSSTDALILENELIKSYRPKYNVALKDGKSYPYIAISNDPYPRISLYRGKRRRDVEYFGPYPNARSAREAMVFLQKIFKIRDCRNSMFKNRSNPCMLYQIKRCSGPCVGLVSKDDYLDQVNHVRRFLKGESKQVLFDLDQQMNQSSKNQDYEKAAFCRDAISYVSSLLEKQNIEREGHFDIWSLGQDAFRVVIQHFVIRDGKIKHVAHQEFDGQNIENEELSSWIYRHYMNEPVIKGLIIHIDEQLNFSQELTSALIDQGRMKREKIRQKDQDHLKQWLELAKVQLENVLPFLAVDKNDYQKMIIKIAKIFELQDTSNLMLECFDISHLQGDFTIGSHVTLSEEGLRNDLYRIYKIQQENKSDDYASTFELLSRRAKKLQADDKKIWIIDGGKGQLSTVKEIMDSSPQVVGMIGIAKGPTRTFANEKYFLQRKGEHRLELINLELGIRQTIGRLRDEAHRFALNASRKQHQKSVMSSRLDEIPGVGAVAKRRLKTHFGSVKNIMSASPDQLMQVPGIGKDTANKIYAYLQDSK